MNFDEQMISRCLDLAKLGLGTVSPNPLVGAVIVKDGIVIGEGYHHKAGTPHAEVNAVNDAISKGYNLKGCTLYCSLEPCCHTNKRTPPCTEMIIKHGFSRVVVCNLDPNPFVAGKGLKRLEEQNIACEHGILSDIGEEINRVFFYSITHTLPYVHLKIASTLDGKMCTSTGDSQWITGIASRTRVHQMRYEYDAIMVGKGTAETDNPSLTIRNVDNHGKYPWRIIVGENINSKLKVFNDEHKDKTIVISGDLKASLHKLYEQGITSVLCEGGSKLASDLLSAGLVNRLSIFVAPKFIGNGKSFFTSDFKLMSDAKKLKNVKFEIFDDEVHIQGDI